MAIHNFNVQMATPTPVYMEIQAPPGPIWWVKRILISTDVAPQDFDLRAGDGGGTGGYLLDFRGAGTVVPTQFDFDDYALSASEGLWLLMGTPSSRAVGTIQYVTGLSS